MRQCPSAASRSRGWAEKGRTSDSMTTSRSSTSAWAGSKMREAVIVDAVRTPIGRRGGALSEVHPVDLSAHVLEQSLARTDLEPEAVDDVVWGCVTQLGDQSGNVGRFALLAAGWPEEIPGVTINRACGSSHQAIEFAAMGVMSGRYDLAVAGGVESMT